MHITARIMMSMECCLLWVKYGTQERPVTLQGFFSVLVRRQVLQWSPGFMLLVRLKEFMLEVEAMPYFVTTTIPDSVTMHPRSRSFSWSKPISIPSGIVIFSSMIAFLSFAPRPTRTFSNRIESSTRA